MRPDPRYYFLLFILLNISCGTSGQDPTKVYALGNSVVEIKTAKYKAGAAVVLVQLHHNEKTAGAVAQHFSDSLKIGFLQINNGDERLISFGIEGTSYRFDPNRMFSKEGIAASLKLHSAYNDEAANAVDSFGRWLLGLLNAETIVAVHNNSNEDFTLNRL